MGLELTISGEEIRHGVLVRPDIVTSLHSAAACDDGGSSRDCSETSLRTHDNGASSLVSVKEEVATYTTVDCNGEDSLSKDMCRL